MCNSGFDGCVILLEMFFHISTKYLPFLPELYELEHVAMVDAHLCILQPCMHSFLD